MACVSQRCWTDRGLIILCPCNILQNYCLCVTKVLNDTLLTKMMSRYNIYHLMVMHHFYIVIWLVKVQNKYNIISMKCISQQAAFISLNYTHTKSCQNKQHQCWGSADALTYPLTDLGTVVGGETLGHLVDSVREHVSQFSSFAIN